MHNKGYHARYKADRRLRDPEWRDRQNAYIAERKRVAFRKAAQVKAEAGCKDCGEKDSVVLDFDHRDPAEKTESVSQMIRNARNWEVVEAEILKCDVRCANCHRRRTAVQQGWCI